MSKFSRETFFQLLSHLITFPEVLITPDLAPSFPQVDFLNLVPQYINETPNFSWDDYDLHDNVSKEMMAENYTFITKKIKKLPFVLNHIYNSHYSPFSLDHVCIIAGRGDLFQWIVEHRLASLGLPDSNPFHLTIDERNDDGFKRFTDCRRSSFWDTHYRIAVQFNQFKIIKYLVENHPTRPFKLEYLHCFDNSPIKLTLMDSLLKLYFSQSFEFGNCEIGTKSRTIIASGSTVSQFERAERNPEFYNFYTTFCKTLRGGDGGGTIKLIEPGHLLNLLESIDAGNLPLEASLYNYRLQSLLAPFQRFPLKTKQEKLNLIIWDAMIFSINSSFGLSCNFSHMFSYIITNYGDIIKNFIIDFKFPISYVSDWSSVNNQSLVDFADFVIRIDSESNPQNLPEKSFFHKHHLSFVDGRCLTPLHTITDSSLIPKLLQIFDIDVTYHICEKCTFAEHDPGNNVSSQSLPKLPSRVDSNLHTALPHSPPWSGPAVVAGSTGFLDFFELSFDPQSSSPRLVFCPQKPKSVGFSGFSGGFSKPSKLRRPPPMQSPPPPPPPPPLICSSQLFPHLSALKVARPTQFNRLGDRSTLGNNQTTTPGQNNPFRRIKNKPASREGFFHRQDFVHPVPGPTPLFSTIAQFADSSPHNQGKTWYSLYGKILTLLSNGADPRAETTFYQDDKAAIASPLSNLVSQIALALVSGSQPCSLIEQYISVGNMIRLSRSDGSCSLDEVLYLPTNPKLDHLLAVLFELIQVYNVNLNQLDSAGYSLIGSFLSFVRRSALISRRVMEEVTNFLLFLGCEVDTHHLSPASALKNRIQCTSSFLIENNTTYLSIPPPLRYIMDLGSYKLAEWFTDHSFDVGYIGVHYHRGGNKAQKYHQLDLNNTHHQTPPGLSYQIIPLSSRPTGRTCLHDCFGHLNLNNHFELCIEMLIECAIKSVLGDTTKRAPPPTNQLEYLNYYLYQEINLDYQAIAND